MHENILTFCDVLVPYYKIVSSNAYYHTPNLALYGTLFPSLLWDSIFCPLKQIVTFEMIRPSKDVKRIAYSKNDIDCTMKLIFPTSLLEVLHQN
jgi:hypothetical protein